MKKSSINFQEKKTIQVVSELSLLYNIKDKKKFFSDIMSIAQYLYTHKLTTVNGVENFLINTKHFRLIGSNNIKERIIAGLKKTNIYNFFSEDLIFSFDQVGLPKPKPDIFLNAINKSGIKKNETLIIEDSAIGVQAAVAAGVKVVGLIAGSHWHKERSTKELYNSGACGVVNNYKEMILILNKL